MLVKPISAPPVSSPWTADDVVFGVLVAGPSGDAWAGSPSWRQRVAELVSAHEFAVALNASGLSTDGPVLDGEQVWSFFVDGLALLGLPEMRRLARVHLDAIDDLYDGQPSAGDRAAYRAAVRAQWGSERRLKRCMHVAVDYLAGLSRML